MYRAIFCVCLTLSCTALVACCCIQQSIHWWTALYRSCSSTRTHSVHQKVCTANWCWSTPVLCHHGQQSSLTQSSLTTRWKTSFPQSSVQVAGAELGGQEKPSHRDFTLCLRLAACNLTSHSPHIAEIRHRESLSPSSAFKVTVIQHKMK